MSVEGGTYSFVRKRPHTVVREVVAEPDLPAAEAVPVVTSDRPTAQLEAAVLRALVDDLAPDLVPADEVTIDVVDSLDLSLAAPRLAHTIRRPELAIGTGTFERFDATPGAPVELAAPPEVVPVREPSRVGDLLLGFAIGACLLASTAVAWTLV